MDPDQPDPSSATSETAGESQRFQLDDPQTLNRSCVTCYRRKVKCDRKYPCRACERARVECIPATAENTRNLQRRDGVELATKLTRLESLLEDFENAQYGPASASSSTQPRATPSVRTGPAEGDSPSGNEYVSSQQTRSQRLRTLSLASLRSSRLSIEIREQIMDLKSFLRGSDTRLLQTSLSRVISGDETSFPFGPTTPNTATTPDSSLPPAGEMFTLWNVYQQRVHPLFKIIHAPTVESLLYEATQGTNPIGVENTALLSAIMQLAITSLGEASCQQLLNQDRATALNRRTAATEQALSQAGVMATNKMTVLQALMAFILSIRHQVDFRTTWSYISIAIRIGVTIGFHRSYTTATPFSSLEVEMRRRLMHELIALDMHTANLAGSDASLISPIFDTDLPLGVDDKVLSNVGDPFDAYSESSDTSEMSFCLIRYEIHHALRQFVATYQAPLGWQSLASESIPTDAKQAFFNRFEAHLQSRYLSQNVQENPMHRLRAMVSSTSVAKMRLVSCLPALSFAQAHPGQDTSALQLRFTLFDMCLENLEFQYVTCQTLEDYTWELGNYFEWYIFTYLLHELTHFTVGPKVDYAWNVVRRIFADLLPKIAFGERTQEHLLAPTRDLARRAWAAHVHSMQSSEVSSTSRRSSTAASTATNPATTSANPFNLPPAGSDRSPFASASPHSATPTAAPHGASTLQAPGVAASLQSPTGSSASSINTPQSDARLPGNIFQPLSYQQLARSRSFPQIAATPLTVGQGEPFPHIGAAAGSPGQANPAAMEGFENVIAEFDVDSHISAMNPWLPRP